VETLPKSIKEAKEPGDAAMAENTEERAETKAKNEATIKEAEEGKEVEGEASTPSSGKLNSAIAQAPPLPEGADPPKTKMRPVDLGKLKIDELKARLRKFELEDRGKKQEMIDRLKEAGGDETPEEPPPDPARELSVFEHKDKVQDAHFSKDGVWLITACRDKIARIFDIETIQVLASYGHSNWISTVHLSEDQSVLCTSCDDGYVRMWNVKKEEELMTFDLGAPVTCAVFSPDNKMFCSASKTGAAQVFTLLPQ